VTIVACRVLGMSSTSVEQRRPFTFPRRPLLTLTALLREMSTRLHRASGSLNPLYRWIDGVAATLNLRGMLADEHVLPLVCNAIDHAAESRATVSADLGHGKDDTP